MQSSKVTMDTRERSKTGTHTNLFLPACMEVNKCIEDACSIQVVMTMMGLLS